MDLSTMIVDLLRGDEAAKLGLSTPATPRKTIPPANVGASEFAAAGQHLRDPLYTAYKREALSNGEPVLSPEEFKRAQAEGRL
jgi:hypothetical protein